MSHAMVFCDICNIGVSSEVTMRDHVKGRRHQQALVAVERRKALARNSLYCHGFPPSTSQAVLQSYFQVFGVVTRIMVETHRGCYCIVQYDSEAPVQRALAQRNHQLLGCPLTVRPRKPITPYRRPSDNDRNLRKVKATQEEEEQVEATHEQLMKNLLQAGSVLSQMEMLYETMRLSDAELERRQSVCQYLQSVLTPFFPTCTIHQFGSSVNGFGMRGCDMDIFLDLHDTEISLQWEETLRQKLKPVNLPYIREIQSLKTTEGPLLPSQLRQLSLVHRVKLLSRILMQQGHQCANVLFVPSVRCPIVRFVHLPTGIKCDLSINNRLALCNTKLLRMCAEDRRVRLLVFAVRYWGKWKQVAGNQNCGPRLSNYCLSLLVLFYLANTTPPVLPSVQSLADLADPNQKCIVEEWDCSLPDAVPPSLNTQPADELLRGFFQFYSQVSLSSSVIQIRPGTVVPLGDFLVAKLNTPALKDFKVKAMAVQDPFVLHHNIAQNINNQVRDQLVQEISNAVCKTSTWSSMGTATSDQTSQPLCGLPYLFSAQDSKPAAQNSADPTASSSSSSSSWCQVVNSNEEKPSQWTCLLSLDLSVLSEDVLAALQAKGDYRGAWFRRIRTLFLWVLRDVFLFTVKMDKDGEVLEDKHLEAENDEEEMCLEKTEGGGESSEWNKVGGASGADDQPAGVSGGEGDDQHSKVSKGDVHQHLNTSDGDGVDHAESCGAEEGTSAASHLPEGQELNSNPTQSGAVLSEDGLMQSPQFEHSCSLHSPGEGQLSPMAVSESSPPSPGSGEVRKTSPHSHISSLRQQTAVASNSPQLDSLVMPEPPCSPLTVSQGSPSRTVTQGHDVSGARPVVEDAALGSDVEMTIDPNTDAAHPSRSQVDSPIESRALPHRGAMGEAASGTFVSPLRVECSPVGDGEVCGRTKDCQLRPCDLEAATMMEAGPSLQQDVLRVEPGRSSDQASASPVSAQNLAQGSAATPCEVSAPTCSTRHEYKKCKALRIYCEGKCKAWYGRKVMRSILMDEGHTDLLELEKLISQRIAVRDLGSSLTALTFHCTLSPVPKGDGAEAEIWFQPDKPVPKEFSVFTTFFKSFFTKLVPKNLLESATV